jgi:MFS transporter, YQGE family, putative transporter
MLLGLTWGCYWAGANTFNFDVTEKEQREYYFGWLHVGNGSARLIAPLLSAAVIYIAPDKNMGYHLLFMTAVLLYSSAFLLSFRVPHDRIRRPFRIWRALLPGRDQRDWQWIMLASLSQAGAFSIFYVLIGLAMFMETNSETSVGGITALQGLVSITAAWVAGRFVVPRTRIASMRWGVIILFLGGVMMLFPMSVLTLTAFGFFRALAQPLFSIPHFGIRLDVIENCAEDPGQRIEYISAWEVPLAIGRLIMMSGLFMLAGWLTGDAIRIILFLLCTNRVLTYFCLTRVSFVRNPEPVSLFSSRGSAGSPP